MRASQAPLGHLIKLKLDFNQNDKNQIVLGCKSRVTKQQAMTGAEFCRLVGISWSTIETIRKVDQEKNLKYFVLSLMEIPDIKDFIVDLLESHLVDKVVQ